MLIYENRNRKILPASVDQLQILEENLSFLFYFVCFTEDSWRQRQIVPLVFYFFLSLSLFYLLLFLASFFSGSFDSWGFSLVLMSCQLEFDRSICFILSYLFTVAEFWGSSIDLLCWFDLIQVKEMEFGLIIKIWDLGLVN